MRINLAYYNLCAYLFQGLSFLFNLNVVDSYIASQENIGLKFLVSDQNLPLFPDSEGNNLSPGTDAKIVISLVIGPRIVIIETYFSFSKADYERINAISSKCSQPLSGKSKSYFFDGHYHPEVIC